MICHHHSNNSFIKGCEEAGEWWICRYSSSWEQQRESKTGKDTKEEYSRGSKIVANLSGAKPLQPILPEAESWIFLWLNTFDYLKVVAQNYGCDSLVLSLHLVIYSVINDFTSEIKNNSSFPKTMNGDCLLAIWTNKTLKTCKQCTLG